MTYNENGFTFPIYTNPPKRVKRASNTFRRNPEPEPGFIDARRDDGCVPSITSLGVSDTPEERQEHTDGIFQRGKGTGR